VAEEKVRDNKKKEEKIGWQKTVVLYMHDLIYMLVIIMILFLLVFRVIVVSGSSMYSTLIDGDYLLLISNLFYQEPEYGDIIVASKDSFDDGAPIIKRVIATEGQTVDIDFVEGIVYVDGEPLQEDYTYTPTNMEEGMEFPLTVDENCIFAMGDNRNRSRDSRSPEIGQIDKREILGKAVFLFLPGTDEGHRGPDYERMGAIK
jgi:signal peptidase I